MSALRIVRRGVVALVITVATLFALLLVFWLAGLHALDVFGIPVPWAYSTVDQTADSLHVNGLGAVRCEEHQISGLTDNTSTSEFVIEGATRDSVARQLERAGFAEEYAPSSANRWSEWTNARSSSEADQRAAVEVGVNTIKAGEAGPGRLCHAQSPGVEVSITYR